MKNKFKTFPKITPLSISNCCLKCNFQDTKLIGDNHIGILINENEEIIWGRFKNVNKNDYICEFHFDNEIDIKKIELGKQIIYCDGYWGERIEYIIDPQLNWEKISFKSSDAINLGGSWRKLRENETPDQIKEKLMPNGWDHEHCMICYDKINESDDLAYRNKNDDWLCLGCVEKYLLKKNFDFLNPKDFKILNES